MNISTEGVLVLASSKGLMNEYKDKEFDYDFPEGLSNLLDQQIIIALTTSGGDELILEFEDGNKSSDEDFDKEINQFITLQPEDELLILSHGAFTMICDENGDYRKSIFPIEKRENLEPGTYNVNIKIKNLDDDEFDEYEAYFKLTLTLSKVGDIKQGNKVVDISD